MINLISHYSNGEKLYEKVVTPVLKTYNLTYMEFNIIMFLNNNKMYDTASLIVKYRHLVKSHVSTTLKSLINKGYIKTNYLENDHKTIHLKLTDKVEDIVRDGLKKQEEFQNLILENFKEDEVDLFLEFLNRVNTNIDKNL